VIKSIVLEFSRETEPIGYICLSIYLKCLYLIYIYHLSIHLLFIIYLVYWSCIYHVFIYYLYLSIYYLSSIHSSIIYHLSIYHLSLSIHPQSIRGTLQWGTDLHIEAEQSDPHAASEIQSESKRLRIRGLRVDVPIWGPERVSYSKKAGLVLIPSSSAFCSMHALRRLDETWPHGGDPSTLLMSSKALTDTWNDTMWPTQVDTQSWPSEGWSVAEVMGMEWGQGKACELVAPGRQPSGFRGMSPVAHSHLHSGTGGLVKLLSWIPSANLWLRYPMIFLWGILWPLCTSLCPNELTLFSVSLCPGSFISTAPQGSDPFIFLVSCVIYPFFPDLWTPRANSLLNVCNCVLSMGGWGSKENVVCPETLRSWDSALCLKSLCDKGHCYQGCREGPSSQNPTQCRSPSSSCTYPLPLSKKTLAKVLQGRDMVLAWR
jgi:hypothetical protein